MRTTINIDIPLLKKIREIGLREHKSFTQLVQELLAIGVGARQKRVSAPSPFRQWHSKNLGARIDYRDKEALYGLLDQRERRD